MIDPHEEATSLYQSGRYREALIKYQSLAQQGDIRAKLILAGMLDQGLGAERDREKSEYWYKQAAESGAPEAQHHLGYMAYHRHDYLIAHSWYQKSASQGYLPSVWRLAWLYRQGKGVPLDKGKAYELFDQAARDGHLFAKRDQALMLLKGQKGFTQSYKGLSLLLACILDGVRIASKSDPDEKLKI